MQSGAPSAAEAKSVGAPAAVDGPTLAEQQARLGQNAQKWGPTIWSYGWTAVPNALLEGQRRLGISDSGLAVLLYLLKHWWTADSRAFAAQATIASASGKSTRTVQRALKNISKLVDTTPRRKDGTGNFQSNEYTFQPLIDALEPLARDFAQQREEANAAREAARKPGIRAPRGKAGG